MAKKTDTFENNITELEKIISELQSGEATLEECIKLYENGMELSAKCIKMLEEAEQKVKVISLTNDCEKEE